MVGDPRPKIILLGHTSAGKTTLLRTLVRRQVGEIAERANVTQTQEPVEHASLQAIFIDSPGFQQAGKLSLAIEFNIDLRSQPDLLYDSRAYDGIRLADIIVYVASLEVAPDDGHRQELALLTRTSLPITAVLNKCGGLYQKREMRVVQRYDEWAKCFREFNIDYVQFDAHFDEYSKLSKLYTALKNKLSSSKAAALEQGIAEFDRRIEDGAKAEFLLFQEMMLGLQAFRVEANDSDHQYDASKTEEYLKNGIKQEINERLSKLAVSCAAIWELTTGKYDLPYKQFTAEVEKETRISEVSKTGAAHAAGFATFGSGVGAIIGAIIGAFVVPVLGAVGGAAAGASYGGMFGTGIGVITGTVAAYQGHYKMKMSREDLEFVAQKAVVLMWGISNHGYGKSSAVNLQEQIGSLSQYGKLVVSNGERLAESLDGSNLWRFYSGNMKLLDESV